MKIRILLTTQAELLTIHDNMYFQSFRLKMKNFNGNLNLH